MKAGFLVGIYKMQVKETPKPTIADGEALIAISACGICGSDIHDAARAQEPRIPGHEFSGTIAEIRGDALGFKVGEQVVLDPIMRCGQCSFCKQGKDHLCEKMAVIGCQTPGGFAEFAVVPNKNMRRIPAGLSPELATLADPLAVTLHAADIAGDIKGKNCLVYGAGTLGLFMIQVLKMRGAAKVAVVDIAQERLEVAKKLDPSFITVNPSTDPQYKAVEGINFELLIELAGGSAPTLPDAVNRGGKDCLILLIAQRAPTEINCWNFMFGEKRLQGVFGQTAKNYKQAVEMLGKGEINGKALLTHVFTLDKVQEAYDMARSPKSVKVVVKPK